MQMQDVHLVKNASSQWRDYCSGMCTRPSEPRPRRDPCLRDRDVQNFVQDDTQTRRFFLKSEERPRRDVAASDRDAGRDLETTETLSVSPRRFL